MLLFHTSRGQLCCMASWLYSFSFLSMQKQNAVFDKSNLNINLSFRIWFTISLIGVTTFPSFLFAFLFVYHCMEVVAITRWLHGFLYARSKVAIFNFKPSNPPSKLLQNHSNSTTKKKVRYTGWRWVWASRAIAEGLGSRGTQNLIIYIYIINNCLGPFTRDFLRV